MRPDEQGFGVRPAHRGGPPPTAGASGRRQVLRAGLQLLGVGLAAAVLRGGRGPRVRAADGRAPLPEFDAVPGLSPWVTPGGEFYKVSKNLFDPDLRRAAWSLRVFGHVERPFAVTLDELRTLAPPVRQPTTLSCISNPVGGDLIGNAYWTGIPLRALLQRAGLRPGVVDVRLEAADGYTDSLPLARAMDPATLVVWEMNDRPLPPDHGYPARLVVPGIYGMKNVKWLTAVEAVTEDYKGYWERRGWSDEAVTQTLSRFDVPRAGRIRAPAPVVLAGIAFAGDRGVSAVEVSTDGGRTWRPAEVEPSPSPLTWVRWRAAWSPPGRGRYTLAVRAVDGRGRVQEAERRPALPDGATGYHLLEVEWLG